jgi:hypothetical protein
MIRRLLSTLLSRKVGGRNITPSRTLNQLLFYARSRFFSGTAACDDRQIHAFGVGLPRSGTHSIGHLLGPPYSCDHEPMSTEAIISILDWKQGKLSDHRLKQILAYRDACLCLDLEASHFLHLVIPQLVDLYPDAKFILTIREPFSWLESEMNKNQETLTYKVWHALEEFRYGQFPFDYDFDELRGYVNLYPIRTYLAYWKAHIEAVLTHVPKDRLLILDTFEISDRLDEIAQFLGVLPEAIEPQNKHIGKRISKAIILRELLPESEVRSLIRQELGDFISRHLPHFESYLK